MPKQRNRIKRTVPDKTLTFALLSTTGPSPAEDRVVEAAALRIDADGQRAEFSQLTKAGADAKAFQEISGLKPADFARSRQPKTVLRKLAEFCGDGPVVTHDAESFQGFFGAARLRPPACLDALDLARIAVPTATDYGLAGLAAELGIDVEGGARAPARVALLAAVWSALMERLTALPPAVLDQVHRLATAALHPLASVLSEMSGPAAFELSADALGALRGLFADHGELFRRVQKHEADAPTDEPLPTEKICRMFSPGGAVGRHLPGYEERVEQGQMVEAVCEALNAPHHLMVEAGTGTGKSMGYLLPAIAWSCTNKDKVVVSTNTRNLQEQLYRKDLPFLNRLLPGRFEAALLKGRRNYLCVRRFLHMMRHFGRELSDPDQILALAPLASWAVRTESGDLTECNGFFVMPGAPAVMQAVTSTSDQCAGRACPVRGRCFVRRARALAQLADVIVVNHALLFAEVGTPVLPPYRCVVFDEAHNLEDVATDAFAADVNRLSFYRVTNLLHRQRHDGTGGGLLATVMYEVGRSKLSEKERSALTAAAGNAMGAVEEVVKAARQLFELLAPPFAEMPPYVERLLLAECEPYVGRGSEAWGAAARARETVHSLGESVEGIAAKLDDLGERMESAEELAHDLRANVERLREAAEAARFVLAEEDEGFVYWLERTGGGRATFYSLHAAPLHVGQHVRDAFFAPKRTVILTSATLQVDGEFDYVLERLGADLLPPGQIRCLAVGSPFDYDRQALVGVTTFLPDPGGQRDRSFDERLGAFLQDLMRVTRGRALVLFTSYSLLEAVYEAVKQPLERAGITVLAQGHTGSREAITAFFRNVTSSVLLGTRSFWEGVDIAGDALSCLVLTKLPFHVHTDPLVRGRTAHLEALGRDPFSHYTLPEAVIGFRQGFGRLIRRGTDRGVIVVTDRRIVTKAYGQTFLRSLPTRHHVFAQAQQALAAVDEFFGTLAGEADAPPVE